MYVTFKVPIQYCSYSTGLYFYLQSHPHLGIVFTMVASLHTSQNDFISFIISPLFSSSILGTYQPGDFMFQCDIFLPFHTLGRHNQNLVHTRTQEKRTVTPQETDTQLPLNVQESPAKAWVSSILLHGQGHWVGQCVQGTFWRRLPLYSLPPL